MLGKQQYPGEKLNIRQIIIWYSANLQSEEETSGNWLFNPFIDKWSANKDIQSGLQTIFTSYIHEKKDSASSRVFLKAFSRQKSQI